MQTPYNLHLLFHSFIHSSEIYYTSKMKIDNENWPVYQNVIIFTQCIALIKEITVTWKNTRITSQSICENESICIQGRSYHLDFLAFISLANESNIALMNTGYIKNTDISGDIYKLWFIFPCDFFVLSLENLCRFAWERWFYIYFIIILWHIILYCLKMA